MKKKKTFTLLEIMIVICLIGLISGILGYSMKGTLDEGKAFRTRQAQERLRDLIEMEIAKGYTIKTPEEAQKHLKASNLVKDTKALFKDGWGKPFTIDIVEDEVTITSDKLIAYDEKKSQERS